MNKNLNKNPKITAKEEIGKKNPGRVKAGQKLQEWSKANKERKEREMASSRWGWKVPTVATSSL